MSGNDATQKTGVSDGSADDQTQDGLDTGVQNAEHPVKERQHPVAQREAAMSRYEEWRRSQHPDAEVQGDLGAATDDDDDGDDADDEATAGTEGSAPTGDTPSTDEDPVAQFIVKDEAGKAFFKTIVDGKEQLVPLDRARAQLQKHEAAELRLQTASERARALDAREAELRRREEGLAQNRTPSATDASGEDDGAILREAQELVTSLIEEDEAEAAKKLAAALRQARNSGSQVDLDALVEKTAAAVETRRTKAAVDEALVDGLNAYLKEYGETVEADPALRAWHAAKVDELAQTNPTWTPRQCMLEAGKQAEEFAGIKRGSQESNSGTGEQQPAATTVSPRQQRKQALQPVPQSRSAALNLEQPAQPDNSPQAVLNEMRKQRGQPVLPSRRTG